MHTKRNIKMLNSNPAVNKTSKHWNPNIIRKMTSFTLFPNILSVPMRTEDI